MEKNDRDVFRLFAYMGVAVFSYMVFNAIFRTNVNEAVIWSGKGLAVLTLISISVLVSKIFMNKDGNFKKSFFTKLFFIAVAVYFVGMVVGTVLMKELLGIDATEVPIWSDAGAGISYWVSAVTVISANIMRTSE